MNDRYMSLLLQIVYAGADVNPLINSGLTYPQISKLIRHAIADGFIEENVSEKEREFVLTMSGLAFMREGGDFKSVRKDGGWIKPDVNSRIAKLEIYDVYLPTQIPLV